MTTAHKGMGLFQGFWQRVQNFLHYLLLKVLVMSNASSEERRLSNDFGYSADGRWASMSTAAALIAAGDWALEYPFPLPPKVHVGPICISLKRLCDCVGMTGCQDQRSSLP